MSPRKHAQCFQLNAEVEDVQKCIKLGHHTFIVLRGVSGSGKSSFAQRLIVLSQKFIIHSSDKCNAQKLTKLVRESLESYINLIIVDDENYERSTVKKLADMAISHTYECYVLEPPSEHKYSAEECSRNSLRGESVEVIQAKIHEIQKTPISWEHLIQGGEKNVEISPFHDDDDDDRDDHDHYNDGAIPNSLISSVYNNSRNSIETPSSSSTNSINQFFSMLPQMKTKATRTVGTCVTVNDLVQGLAGVEVGTGKLEVGEETVSPYVEKSGIRMVTRSIDTNLSVVHHLLQLDGFASAYQQLQILGHTQAEVTELIDDGIQYEFICDEESMSLSNLSAKEELDNRRVERLTLRLYENAYLKETANDEEIARSIQTEFNKEYEDSQQGVSIAGINKLRAMFPRTEIGEIFGAIEAASHNFDTAVRILLSEGKYLQQSVQNAERSWKGKLMSSFKLQAVPDLHAKQTEKEKKNHFLKSKSSSANLENVQAVVIEERKRLEAERQSRMSSSGTGKYKETAKAAEMCRMRETTATRLHNIDKMLRDAHRNPWNLDLHYMSVDGAKDLVAQAIEAVKFHLRTNKKTSNRILVVTGSGNNSRFGARIKPEVASMLWTEGIGFEAINDGCIMIVIKL
ncbi:unnamed protein product [Caenorhabditis sp. 36 PRJEB53466]|nr:unnamed protein product [Caenorhabditis sp. 36 PRJEB53466]